MARKLDPTIAAVLKEHGFGADACWDCHGTWVVYHRVLEQIAAKAGITYATPQVLVADRDAAAILVEGRRGDYSEWSIGEAVVGLNYKVSGNQAGYPFAMAEKRAKDRVILKLIGLTGLAYSEEEADDFKPKSDFSPKPENTPQDKTTKDAEWKGPLKVTALKDAIRAISRDVLACDDEASLDDIVKKAAPVINQAKHDLPSWIEGDGGDIRGLRAEVEMMRAEFKSREAGRLGNVA